MSKELLSRYTGYDINDITYESIMPIMEKISQPAKVKLYGTYRDIGGEEADMILHDFYKGQRYIYLRVEYGRRFKEIITYKKENESTLNMYYRFIIKFLKWFNDHQ